MVSYFCIVYKNYASSMTRSGCICVTCTSECKNVNGIRGPSLFAHHTACLHVARCRPSPALPPSTSLASRTTLTDPAQVAQQCAGAQQCTTVHNSAQQCTTIKLWTCHQYWSNSCQCLLQLHNSGPKPSPFTKIHEDVDAMVQQDKKRTIWGPHSFVSGVGEVFATG